jgi:hypothetical protein
MVAHIPPQFLYRYRSAGKNYFQEELRRALHNKELYFGSIADANDPFEANPFIQNNSPKQVREYMSEFERLFGKGTAISGTNFYEVAKQHGFKKSSVRKVTGSSFEAANLAISLTPRSLQTLRAKIKISCLSESWDSLLMWGHYGQSHSGVCIEYSPKIATAAADRQAPLAMEYTVQRPTVTTIELLEHAALANNENKENFFDLERAERTFNSIAMTKPMEWEYEREWRVMKLSDDGPGYFRVACLEPTAILLGANHSPETLQTVREISDGSFEIELMSVDRERFALQRKPIK